MTSAAADLNALIAQLEREGLYAPVVARKRMGVVTPLPDFTLNAQIVPRVAGAADRSGLQQFFIAGGIALGLLALVKGMR